MPQTWTILQHDGPNHLGLHQITVPTLFDYSRAPIPVPAAPTMGGGGVGGGGRGGGGHAAGPSAAEEVAALLPAAGEQREATEQAEALRRKAVAEQWMVWSRPARKLTLLGLGLRTAQNRCQMTTVVPGCDTAFHRLSPPFTAVNSLLFRSGG